MRLVMMGTGPFAVPTFRALLDGDHPVQALITRPAVTAATRGKRQTAANPMRELAESRGLPVFDPPSINAPATHEQLRALSADLFVVCDYGQILSPETLALTPLGGINLHGSLLPKYRGAAPIQWAIWRGEQVTGVTVIHMTPQLDAGPCLVQRSTSIGPAETAAQLEPRLAELGVEAVHEALALLSRWDRVTPLGFRQDPGQATRAPRLKKGDGEVDWTRTAEQIHCQFRAVQPWPGCFTHYLRPGMPAVRVILEAIEPVPLTAASAPGTLHRSTASPLVVATGTGGIAIHRLQPAGKRAIDAEEFLRGYPAPPGTRLGSPPPAEP